VEKSIFELEVREKKNQAYLNKARTGSKGGSRSRKGMNTPYDYRSKKEKRNLNGEVESFNMHTILGWTEFERKDKETQKTLLTKWREIYPNTKIMEVLSEGRPSKLNSQSYADIVNELGCPKKQRNVSGPRKARQKTVAINSPVIESQLEFAEPETKQESEKIEQEIKETVQTMLVTRGMHLEYNGNYDVDALNRLFTKLQLLVDGEPNKYRISLSLSEIIED
jgi:hypothetical protein